MPQATIIGQKSRTLLCHYSDQFKSGGDWAETKPQK